MKLSRIYVDFISSLKTFFRGRSSFIWVLAFPIVIMLIFGAIFNSNATFQLAIQDKDGSYTSAAFMRDINATSLFKVRMLASNEDADAYLRSARVSGVLIIPQGFGKHVQQNLALGAARPAAVMQVNSSLAGRMNESAVTANRMIFQSQALHNNTAVTPAALILKLDQSSNSAPAASGVIGSITNAFNSKLTNSAQVVDVENQQALSSDFRYIDYFVPGVISMAVVMSCVLGTVGMQTQYRNSGILTKLGTTPLKKSEWIVSKMLYQTVVVFISTAAIVIVAKFVYNVRALPDAATLPLLFAGATCFTGIAMIVARFVKDEDAATAASSTIIIPMLFLSGVFIPIERMPNYLQTVANLLPLTYLTDGLRDAMLFGDTASALYKTFIILLLGIIFLAVGALVTNWREDDTPALLRRGGPVTARRAAVLGVVAVALIAICAAGVVSIIQGPQPNQTVVPSETIASVPKAIASVPKALTSVPNRVASAPTVIAAVTKPTSGPISSISTESKQNASQMLRQAATATPAPTPVPTEMSASTPA